MRLVCGTIRLKDIKGNKKMVCEKINNLAIYIYIYNIIMLKK